MFFGNLAGMPRTELEQLLARRGGGVLELETFTAKRGTQ